MGKEDKSLGFQWEPVNSSTPYKLPYLDIAAHLEMKVNPEPERMEFWDDIYTQYNGDVM